MLMYFLAFRIHSMFCFIPHVDELLDLDLEGIRALIPNQDIINIQLSDAKVGISKLGKQLNKKKLPTKMFYRLSEKYGNILKKKRRRKKKKVVEVDINDSSVDAYAYVSASSHKKRGSKTTKAKKVARKQKNGNKRSHKPQAERSSVKEAMHQIEINTPIKKKSANSSSSQASFRSPYSRVLHMQSQLSSSPNGTAVKTSSSKSKLIRSKSSKRFVGERERGKGRLKGKSAESKRAGVRKSDRLKFSMNTKAAKGKTLSNASLSSSSLFRWKAGDTRMPRTQSAAFLRPDKELVECRLRGGRKEWNVGTEKASIPSYDFMQDTHALKAKHLQRQRAMEAEREKHSARGAYVCMCLAPLFLCGFYRATILRTFTLFLSTLFHSYTV